MDIHNIRAFQRLATIAPYSQAPGNGNYQRPDGYNAKMLQLYVVCSYIHYLFQL